MRTIGENRVCRRIPLSKSSLAWLLIFACSSGPVRAALDDDALNLTWADDMLTVRGAKIAGGAIEIHYLEAFCRPGSTDRDWKQTTIPHRTVLVSNDPDRRTIRLRSTLEDGVIVDHTIKSGRDEVDFHLTARNPTNQTSRAHWAQPCIRVDKFVGVKPEPNSEAYLNKCFVFIDNKLTRLPTRPWATKARYVPGQVWRPVNVDRDDVNPRPLSPLIPSNGLIGCYSADETQILATAWEPYQELFQGVIVCIHSDFRIAGLEPGETKRVRGKLYLVPADVNALVKRYQTDFPEHAKTAPK